MSQDSTPPTSEPLKFRLGLSITIIVLAFLCIIIVSIGLVVNGETADREKLFTTIIPLLATWVGTVLAFYYGRSNFDAATSKYKEIVDKLSPEALAQVQVDQIMILKKTMILKSMSWANEKTIGEIREYLNNDVDKSRLPLLENGVVKYVLHRDLLKSVQSEMQFKIFISQKENQRPFVNISSSDTIEVVRSKMAAKSGCEDAFVVNVDGKLEGWITDSLITRYLARKK